MDRKPRRNVTIFQVDCDDVRDFHPCFQQLIITRSTLRNSLICLINT